MKKFSASTLVFLFALGLAADIAVIHADKAVPPERTAAEELALHLSKALGENAPF